MSTQKEAIVYAAKVQAESCQYTSAAFYYWISAATFKNRLWNAVPIIFGSLASFAALEQSYPVVAALLALGAGLLPAIYEKLELKAHTDELVSQAGQYKNLENRFIHCAEITAFDPDASTLRMKFDALMGQMEDLRSRPLVVPEKYFLKARKKIREGHLKTDVQE